MDPDAHGRRIELALVADEPCAPQLRQVLLEQLAGLAGDISWSCRPRLDEEELFHSTPTRNAAVRIWIDVSSPNAARLFIEDEQAERFVVRRIALSNGVDEVSREELGQIVRFGALSILEARSQTLTRTEVRAALSRWPEAHSAPARGDAAGPRTADAHPDSPARVDSAAAAAIPAPRAGPTPARAWGLASEFGAAWSAQAFSREVPVVQEIALAAALTGRSRSLFTWMEAGYQLPATYRNQLVSVKLEALSLRLGLTFKRRAGGWGAWGLGVGAGANRNWFSPGAASTAVEVDAPGHFASVTGRLLFTLDVHASARATVGLRVFCDVPTTRVRYELRDADGSNRRVLALFGLAPGLSLVLAVRP